MGDFFKEVAPIIFGGAVLLASQILIRAFGTMQERFYRESAERSAAQETAQAEAQAAAQAVRASTRDLLIRLVEQNDQLEIIQVKILNAEGKTIAALERQEDAARTRRRNRRDNV